MTEEKGQFEGVADTPIVTPSLEIKEMMKKKEEKPIVFNSIDDLPLTTVSLGSMRVNKTYTWRNLRPVIDAEKCIYCQICWKFCPEPSVFPGMPPQIDYEYCKGCGICEQECPVKAIVMLPEGK